VDAKLEQCVFVFCDVLRRKIREHKADHAPALSEDEANGRRLRTTELVVRDKLFAAELGGRKHHDLVVFVRR
jgi:hypothetical protein